MRTVRGLVVQLQTGVHSQPCRHRVGGVAAAMIPDEPDRPRGKASSRCSRNAKKSSVRSCSRIRYHPRPVRIFSTPNRARGPFVPCVGRRSCWPTPCHMARSKGWSCIRDAVAYRIAASGLAATTALATTYGLEAFSGSTLSGIAKRGRLHRSPTLCKAAHTVLALHHVPSRCPRATATIATVPKVATSPACCGSS
jgi:hypothetical protein